jgi:hypothetical protein
MKKRNNKRMETITKETPIICTTEKILGLSNLGGLYGVDM